MISSKKRTGILAAVVVVAILLLVASCFGYVNGALADTNTDNTYNYFYNQISTDPIAERFYKAFETLYANGEFKDGKLQYDLIANEVATDDEVKAYVNGADDNRLAKSYGIGRDAFYMDHPDLFYIDVFSTSITAGMQNGKYVAYLDSSRVVSLYTGSSINSKSKVNKAIDEYENKIASIVAEANKKESVVEKIEYVNDYICKNTTYGFGVDVKDGRNVDTDKADYIYTSYGALVNKESVCEGYAKSFKAVMDRLGIPCACVQGYAGNHETMSPHMWNYVQVEGMWYAVDVTYNATAREANPSIEEYPYMLLGNETMLEDHVEDGVVSSSGYELRYPALKPYDYGSDEDKNGMTIVGTYTQTENEGMVLEISVSYKGKGAHVLQEEGKYLAYSFSHRDYANNQIVWSEWASVVDVNEAWKIYNGYECYTITDTETRIPVYSQVEHIKFAVFDYAPDLDSQSLGYFDGTGDYPTIYNPENLTAEHFVCAESAPYRNEGFDSYNPAPNAQSITPSNTGELKYTQAIEVEIVYDEMLELDDGFGSGDIGMTLEASLGNSSINKYAKIENFHWDGDKTITFTLTPSQMYIHIGACYYLTPKGLVGAISKKVPNPVTYYFVGKTVVCSRVFNDGRLYMLMYGAPSLIDDTDVSITDFKDENGNYFAESQRSQLLLVASKKSGSEEQELTDTLKGETGIVDNDIVTSSTYEIDLQLCGCVQTVPNGSFMQVSFGFPEGYDPDDEGTTYKIYHYKHDDKGNIIGVEEIPLIITQYGLIARVTSFSPFTIVQLKNTSAAVTESATANVYAYINGGTGGKIMSGENSASGISTVSDTITYEFTPDKGYTLACVLLNGKVVNTDNGKLTLSKSELESSNTLEVRFMSQELANSYARKGMSIAFNGELTDSYGGKASNAAGIIIGCCVAVVVVVAIALVIWFVMKKKKAQPAMATAGAKSQTKSSAVTKSTVAKQTKPTATKSTAATASKTTAAKSTTTKSSATTASKTTASASKSAAAKSTTKTSATTASKSAAAKSTTKTSATTSKTSSKKK